jgi:Hypothetical glycosyl hydrolase family 15
MSADNTLATFDNYPKPDVTVHGRALPPDFITKKSYSWDKISRYLALYKTKPYSDDEINKLASLDIMQTNPNCYPESQTNKRIKAINPDITILGYRNMIIDHATFKGKFFQEHPEWYLKDKETGEYVTMASTGVMAEKPLFDLRIPEVREWWVNDIKRQCQMPEIDGVLIDALAKVMTDWEPKVRALGGSDKDVLEYTGFVNETLLKNIESNSNEGLILSNAIRSGYSDCLKSYVDVCFHGSYLEWIEQPYPDLYEDHLVRTIDTCIQIGNEGGKFLCFNMSPDFPPVQGKGSAGNKITAEKSIMPEMVDAVSWSDFSSDEKIDRMRRAFEYKLAIYLICACEHSYLSYAGTHCGDFDSRLWFPEYPEFDRSLGEPSGPATKRDDYIYEREFKHVSVELNVKLRQATVNWK